MISSYLYRVPRAFPASCLIPSLVVGRAFSLPDSISNSTPKKSKKKRTLLCYNKMKCSIKQHIVFKIRISPVFVIKTPKFPEKRARKGVTSSV